MVKRTIRKIHDLRIFFLGSFVTIFLFNIGLSPIDLSKYFVARFSQAVGMNVSVPANPVNYLALQLEEKEKKLNRREQALNEQIVQSSAALHSNPLIVMMGSGIGVLFLLIMINYYLDFRRRREERMYWQVRRTE